MDFILSETLDDRIREIRIDQAVQLLLVTDVPLFLIHYHCAVETLSPTPSELAGC